MEEQRTSLRLRVIPGARRTTIVGRYGDAWKVRVTAAAEAGKANEAVLDLLSRTLEVPRSRLEVTEGTRSRDKVVALSGLSVQSAGALLEAAAEDGR